MVNRFKANIPLKNYTTFKIGGAARYFFIAKNKNDLSRAVLWAKKKKLLFFILGGGSNLLISDRGFNGLVVKIQNTKYEVRNTQVVAEAGVPLSLLVNAAANNNLAGLEWAAGIPGTLGGAIYGNAGARTISISDNVKEVEFFDSKRLKFGKFKKNDCQFGYRRSVFKRRKNLVIISVFLELKTGKKIAITNKIKKHIKIKKEKQPLDLPSAGSIFLNPSGFFAAKLIEKSGLAGKRIGNVEISKKHANFILNLGGGKAEDVIELIDLTKKIVKNKFGIKLEEEIQFLGF